MTVEIEALRASIKAPDILCRDNLFAARTPMPRRVFSRGYILMRRTFVIYKDATSSLPNLHQGVQESWPKQAQVSRFNTNILSSQKFQSSNPTTLIFDKTQSSSIQKWLSTLRRVERGVSSSTSICCRPQDMNHVSLTPKRWIPGEILSFMKVLKWWNVCVCVWCVCVWCTWMCVDMCFGLALHCKSKSSDDIINTVSEPDGRSSCFGLCFHLKGNQSLH